VRLNINMGDYLEAFRTFRVVTQAQKCDSVAFGSSQVRHFRILYYVAVNKAKRSA